MTATAAAASIARPQSDEYYEYYQQYVSKVPEGDLISLLREQALDTVTMLQGLSPSQADHAYAPGKWTVKQVIGHIIDAERVFVYRAMCFARRDATALPPFDENSYVDNANFQSRTLADLLEELQLVRAATIQFAKTLDVESLTNRGTASGRSVTVRALLYIVAGHERHHANLLRERYLSQ